MPTPHPCSTPHNVAANTPPPVRPAIRMPVGDVGPMPSILVMESTATTPCAPTPTLAPIIALTEYSVVKRRFEYELTEIVLGAKALCLRHPERNASLGIKNRLQNAFVEYA